MHLLKYNVSQIRSVQMHPKDADMTGSDKVRANEHVS